MTLNITMSRIISDSSIMTQNNPIHQYLHFKRHRIQPIRSQYVYISLPKPFTVFCSCHCCPDPIDIDIDIDIFSHLHFKYYFASYQYPILNQCSTYCASRSTGSNYFHRCDWLSPIHTDLSNSFASAHSCSSPDFDYWFLCSGPHLFYLANLLGQLAQGSCCYLRWSRLELVVR